MLASTTTSQGVLPTAVHRRAVSRAAPRHAEACSTSSSTLTRGRQLGVAHQQQQHNLAAAHGRRKVRRANLVTVRADASNGSSAGRDVENVVIIGSGPAGYTAAIYTARANLRPFVFEGLAAGGVRGGQLMTTTEVENFPGFPEGITGPDLMDRMRAQAERWGANLVTEDVEEVDLSQRPFVIRGSENTVRAHAVIVATGATARRLGIPSEHRFWSAGISACAICDGASPIFKGQEVAVVGGGDTACEEAVYLTKYASHVHLLVRGDRFRASGAMADRALANPRVTVHFNTAVDDAFEDKKGGAMGGLRLRDTATGETRDLAVRGLFYGIGHQPNSAILGGQIETDAAGYVVVRDGCRTSVDGVFAAGDLHDTEWRQAITAAGSGCMAALAAERYLTANDLAVEYHQEQQPEKELAHAAAAATAAAASSSNGNGKSAAAGDEEGTVALETAETFDINATRHRGQYALRRLYHESDRLMAVLYTSPTCGPCKTLKPIFNKVVEEYADRVHLVEIDIEEDPEIAQAAGVNGTPTIQFFKDKDRVESVPGVKMKKQYREIIETYVSTKVPA